MKRGMDSSFDTWRVNGTTIIPRESNWGEGGGGRDFSPFQDRLNYLRFLFRSPRIWNWRNLTITR